MSNELYKVEQEEKLSDIARKFGISEEKLKILNPDIRTFGGGLFSKEIYVSVNQFIKVSEGKAVAKLDNDVDFDFNKSQEKREVQKLEQEDFLKNLTFDQQARYRCEQVNVSKINGNPISSTIQKQQFNLKINKEFKIAKINMEDFYYDLNPPILNRSFEMIEFTEKIRNNVVLNYNEDGKVSKIINKAEQKKAWEKFKDSEFQKLEFIKVLKSNNPKAYNDLIKAGNLQFSLHHPSEYEYQSSYFYMCLFDKHLTAENFKEIPSDKLKYRSAIFPHIDVDIEAPYHLIKLENDLAQIRKVGTMKLTNEQKMNIINHYNEKFKPLLHYQFSNYNVDIRVNRTFDINTRLVVDGKITIIESVQDNIENTCEVTIKKL